MRAKIHGWMNDVVKLPIHVRKFLLVLGTSRTSEEAKEVWMLLAAGGLRARSNGFGEASIFPKGQYTFISQARRRLKILVSYRCHVEPPQCRTMKLVVMVVADTIVSICS